MENSRKIKKERKLANLRSKKHPFLKEGRYYLVEAVPALFQA
jgi:hypothetical protein